MIDDEENVYLIDVKTDDITDYRKTALYLIFPYCSGKCGDVCQNKHLRGYKKLKTTAKSLAEFYNSLHTHEAVVMAGLEPFDSFNDVLSIVKEFCKLKKSVDFVIYTGYTESEYKEMFEKTLLEHFNKYNNSDDEFSRVIIIKYGRYDENCKKEWNSKILGVNLATTNQGVVKYIPSDVSDDFSCIRNFKIVKETYSNE